MIPYTTRLYRWRCRRVLTLLPLAFFICLALGVLPARAAQQGPFDRLFGYQATAVKWHEFPLNMEKHWRRVLKAEQQSPCLQRDSACLSSVDAKQWQYLLSKAPSMDELTLLRSVNAFFNKFPVASDMQLYGKEDYWPTLAEFFRNRSGDCKAYTLAKYFALRTLGMDAGKLRFVMVFQPANMANHAVLAVATTKGVYILDNNVRPIDLIQTQEKCASRFIPMYMLNEQGRWNFGQDEAQLRAKYAKK